MVFKTVDGAIYAKIHVALFMHHPVLLEIFFHPHRHTKITATSKNGKLIKMYLNHFLSVRS